MAYETSKDRYSTPGFPGLGSRAEVISPNDDNDLDNYFDYIYVGVSGNIACVPIRNSSNDPVVFENVPVGFFPVRVRKVLATNTTADSLIGIRD